MKTHLSSLGIDFHVSVDFRFNVSFPHIFLALHPNSIETSWFSLSIHKDQLTEEKSMQSSIVTSRSMLPPPVSAQSTFQVALYKKQIKTKWELLRFMIQILFNWSEWSPSKCSGWHVLIDAVFQHPYCPVLHIQRAEGCPSLLHLHFSVCH